MGWVEEEGEWIDWMDGWMVMRRGGKKSRAAECPVFIFSPERKVEKSFESGWARFDLKQEDFPRLGPASSWTFFRDGRRAPPSSKERLAPEILHLLARDWDIGSGPFLILWSNRLFQSAVWKNKFLRTDSESLVSSNLWNQGEKDSS